MTTRTIKCLLAFWGLSFLEATKERAGSLLRLCIRDRYPALVSRETFTADRNFILRGIAVWLRGVFG